MDFYHRCVMQLNIKNEEVRREATELARMTGETITQAVGRAVHDRLERVRRDIDFEELYADIHAIQQRVAESYRREGRRPPTQDEINELMYDERGLPR